jgi:hypothetical protein
MPGGSKSEIYVEDCKNTGEPAATGPFVCKTRLEIEKKKKK